VETEDVFAYPVCVCRPEVDCGGRGAGYVVSVKQFVGALSQK